MGDAVAYEGYNRQIERLLRTENLEPLVAERVMSFDLMMALVSAGIGLALVGASQMGACRAPGIIARPLAGGSPALTTYLLRRDADAPQALQHFIARVAALDGRSDPLPNADSDELEVSA